GGGPWRSQPRRAGPGRDVDGARPGSGATGLGPMKIGLGADHLGYPLKESIKRHLIAEGHDVIDYGVNDTTPTDYPDIAVTVARAVAAGEPPQAVLVCGTGIGMAITANKVPGVRAASVSDAYS